MRWIVLFLMLAGSLNAQIYTCDHIPPVDPPNCGGCDYNQFAGRILVTQLNGEELCWETFGGALAINPQTDAVATAQNFFTTSTNYNRDSVNYVIQDTFDANPCHVNYSWKDSTCGSADSVYTLADWQAGISIQDLIAVVRHIRGIEPFTEVREYIAADVDLSGWVDYTDLELIQSMLLGLITEFPTTTGKIEFICGETSQTYQYTAGNDPFVFVAQGNYAYLQAVFEALPWKQGPDILGSVSWGDCFDDVNIQGQPNMCACPVYPYSGSWYDSYFSLAIKRGDVNFSWDKDASRYAALKESLKTFLSKGDAEIDMLNEGAVNGDRSAVAYAVLDAGVWHIEAYHYNNGISAAFDGANIVDYTGDFGTNASLATLLGTNPFIPLGFGVEDDIDGI